MNIYSALRFEVPIIAYSALHQVRKGVTAEAYRKTMEDFHRLLREETEAIRKAWDAHRVEASSRAIQSARGLLTQFLSTPLKSDVDDIQRILRERLDEYGAAVSVQARPGMLSTGEGRIVESTDVSFRKLAITGRAYLSELGFHTGKGRPEIYESVFLVEGAGNLDVIEHMVRDRIGIYTPVHGKHIGEFDSYAYNAHNLVLVLGEMKPGATHEAAAWCSKGGVKYDVFRSALKDELERLMSKQKALLHASVWQRKLGLGSGREFVIRLQGNDLSDLCRAVDDLRTGSKEKYVRTALAGGHVLCKELIIP